MARDLYQPKTKALYLMVVLLAAVIAMMVALAKCSHTPKSTFDNTPVKSGGDTLDIAIQMNPAVYSVKGDSIFGRDYQILTEISARHGVPMKFHPFVPLKHATDGLESGVYDMVVASLPLTTALKDKYLMTDPVYIDREVLVQLADSATMIRDQISLAGDTVWIPSASPVRVRIENLSDEIGGKINIMSNDNYTAEHLLVLVARGEIKYAVINENIAMAMLGRYPQIDATLPVSFSQFQSWAIRKDNTQLCDSVNSWLSDLNR